MFFVKLNSKKEVILAATLITFGSVAGGANAAVLIDFEGETSTNVSPASPYLSDGFTFSPINDRSAVLEPIDSTMLGNATVFFGFEEGNTITITGTAPFSLFSLNIGINSDLADDATVDFTITGLRSGLSNLTSSTNSVSSAQTLNLNWAGLDSVTIDVTDDAGIDNISLEAIPEPSSVLLLGLGALGFVAHRKRSN